MAQDHGLCRKKKVTSQMWTGARAATAGPCCSCQRDSFVAGKLLALTDDPGAHGHEAGEATEANEWGQSKLEWGQELDEGSGHGRQTMARQAKHSPQNKPLQANTKPAEQGSAGRLSQRILRPAQALKNKRPTVGRLRSTNNSCHR